MDVNSLLGGTIPLTDRFHLELICQAVKEEKPILGSGRGCQILNVAFGGTLFQDVKYAVASPLQHSQVTQLDQRVHSVETTPERLLQGEDSMDRLFSRFINNKGAF